MSIAARVKIDKSSHEESNPSKFSDNDPEQMKLPVKAKHFAHLEFPPNNFDEIIFHPAVKGSTKCLKLETCVLLQEMPQLSCMTSSVSGQFIGKVLAIHVAIRVENEDGRAFSHNVDRGNLIANNQP